MYNLLIALGIALVVGLFAGVVTGTTIAGFIPGFLALLIAYFLLMRRTGRQLETLMQGVMVIAGRLQQARSPGEQQQIFGEMKTILEKGFELGKWQFLVSAQIHSQLGAMEYQLAGQNRLSRNNAQAKIHDKNATEHLKKAFSRHWQSHVMLALIEWREGSKEDAIKRLESASSAGKSDPMFWGIYSWILLQNKDRAAALTALTKGLEKNKDSDALKAMAEQVRNKRAVSVEAFGQNWLQFFPEDAPKMMHLLQPDQMDGMNRAARRAAKRGRQPNTANNQQHFPHPRR